MDLLALYYITIVALLAIETSFLKVFGLAAIRVVTNTVLAHKSEPSAIFELPHHLARLAQHAITPPIYIRKLKN